MKNNVPANRKQDDKRLIRRIGFITLILTIVMILTVAGITVLYAGRLDIFLPANTDAADFSTEHGGIVELVTDPDDPHHLIVKAVSKGSEYLLNNEEGVSIGFVPVNVLPGNIIVNRTNDDFSGSHISMLVVEIYVLVIGILLAASFALRCRSGLYSYSTLLYGGAALFVLTFALNILQSVFTYHKYGLNYNVCTLFSHIRSAGSSFMLYTIPVMLVAAAALLISNISLIIHEGKSFANLLGVIMSLMIIGGYAVFFFLDRMFTSGSESEMRVFYTIESVYSISFVYLEAMLISTALCGLIAAKKKPSPDRTHMIILGCSVAGDGTPFPLLRGRIDNAVAFAKMQKEKTDSSLKYVPSGGQGSDEVISEAGCIKNYLISQGIAESDIIPEDKSTTTQENMRFSLAKIKEDCPEPRIGFSTSDYHVLRSGIIAGNEGLDAEGTGCRTKWYFWPNAFIREFIGLLWSKRRQHIRWLIFFVLLFAAVNVLLPI